jgi:hypothetical protein
MILFFSADRSWAGEGRDPLGSATVDTAWYENFLSLSDDRKYDVCLSLPPAATLMSYFPSSCTAALSDLRPKRMRRSSRACWRRIHPKGLSALPPLWPFFPRLFPPYYIFFPSAQHRLHCGCIGSSRGGIAMTWDRVSLSPGSYRIFLGGRTGLQLVILVRRMLPGHLEELASFRNGTCTHRPVEVDMGTSGFRQASWRTGTRAPSRSSPEG